MASGCDEKKAEGEKKKPKPKNTPRKCKNGASKAEKRTKKNGPPTAHQKLTRSINNYISNLYTKDSGNVVITEIKRTTDPKIGAQVTVTVRSPLGALTVHTSKTGVLSITAFVGEKRYDFGRTDLPDMRFDKVVLTMTATEEKLTWVRVRALRVDEHAMDALGHAKSRRDTTDTESGVTWQVLKIAAHPKGAGDQDRDPTSVTVTIGPTNTGFNSLLKSSLRGRVAVYSAQLGRVELSSRPFNKEAVSHLRSMLTGDVTIEVQEGEITLVMLLATSANAEDEDQPGARAMSPNVITATSTTIKPPPRPIKPARALTPGR